MLSTKYPSWNAAKHRFTKYKQWSAMILSDKTVTDLFHWLCRTPLRKWHIDSVEILWENDSLFCSHCLFSFELTTKKCLHVITFLGNIFLLLGISSMVNICNIIDNIICNIIDTNNIDKNLNDKNYYVWLGIFERLAKWLHVSIFFFFNISIYRGVYDFEYILVFINSDSEQVRWGILPIFVK